MTETAERRKPISKGTSLPAVTISFALAIVAAIVSATIFWMSAERTRTRQDNYIARDAVEFAQAAEERAEIRAHLIRECIRHAVESGDPEYPCIGAAR